ncbi:MAG: hypothetical protein SFX18_14890 [Pirellulales bacterium]|nr:hypothetical protein [Pirellulales bacterium]
MSGQPHSTPDFCTQVDATLAPPTQPLVLPQASTVGQMLWQQTSVLQQMLQALDRQNELLEELVTHVSSNHKQRNQELHQWKQNHPELVQSCREATEALTRVQAEYLNQLTNEINGSAEDLADGEYVFNEFVDRFGPRLAHLNGMLQVMSQLGGGPVAQQ